MKTKYRLESAAHLVRVDYYGHPTFEEWSARMETIFADPDFTPGWDFLFDKRSAGRAPDLDYVQAVARFFVGHREQIGRAAIVVLGLLPYGMSRMTASLCCPDDSVRVFVDNDEALKWLHEAAENADRHAAHAKRPASRGHN